MASGNPEPAKPDDNSSQSERPNPAQGWLSQIGLAAVVFIVGLLVTGLVTLFPPWIKVKCQRQEMLYFSQVVKDYERSFAGFDFVFSGSKWTSSDKPNVGSGGLFDSTEYRILGPLLYGEWLAIWASAATAFFVYSRRLRAGPRAVE